MWFPLLALLLTWRCHSTQQFPDLSWSVATAPSHTLLPSSIMVLPFNRRQVCLYDFSISGCRPWLQLTCFSPFSRGSAMIKISKIYFHLHIPCRFELHLHHREGRTLWVCEAAFLPFMISKWLRGCHVGDPRRLDIELKDSNYVSWGLCLVTRPLRGIYQMSDESMDLTRWFMDLSRLQVKTPRVRLEKFPLTQGEKMTFATVTEQS